MYNRGVIFREFKTTSQTEEVRENKLENLEFNWSKESHDSDESTKFEVEVETQTSILRRSGRARKQPYRYSPPIFR